MRNTLFWASILFLLLPTAVLSQTTVEWDDEIAIANTQGELVFENPMYQDTTVLVEANGELRDLVFLAGKGTLKHTIEDEVTIKVAEEPATTLKSEAIPLWLSIVPPILAIIIALLSKEVVASLLLGVISGGVIIGTYTSGFSGIFSGIFRTIDHYILNSLTDWGHQAVIVFSVIIGGMVTVISKNGGMMAIVNRISKRANDAKSGQMATYLLGIAIFFDDYANTLVVGNTMRAITDKLRISREKLAYIVDSTAAPIAAVAFVTTWIGAELGYISDGIEQIEASLGVSILEGPYTIFLGSLSYSFYPILTLVFIFLLIWKGKDFGPMLKVEKNARLNGVVENKADESSDDELQPVEEVEPKAYRAIIPICIVIFGTIIGLFYTGWDQAIWDNADLGFGKKLSQTIGASDSYTALLWSSMVSLITAILLSLNIKNVQPTTAVEWSISGFKTMVNAVVILILAWALAEVTKELHTADFLSNSIGDWLPVFLVPAFTFVLAALVAFSTGSSWGTMAILYPLVLPLAWMVCQLDGMDYEPTMAIFFHTVSTVLAGSVLGDHCSPISDTTILSSLASKCNHISHVKTQMPYALTVGGISIVVCSIPAGLGVSPWLTLLAGIGVLYFVVWKFGKRTA